MEFSKLRYIIYKDHYIHQIASSTFPNVYLARLLSSLQTRSATSKEQWTGITHISSDVGLAPLGIYPEGCEHLSIHTYYFLRRSTDLL